MRYEIHLYDVSTLSENKERETFSEIVYDYEGM